MPNSGICRLKKKKIKIVQVGSKVYEIMDL